MSIKGIFTSNNELVKENLELLKSNVDLRKENLEYIDRLIKVNDALIKAYKDNIKIAVEYSDLLAEQQNVKSVGFWKIWPGWEGNHDHRIENAKCSQCGYEHSTIFYSEQQLPSICQACGSNMSLPTNRKA